MPSKKLLSSLMHKPSILTDDVDAASKQDVSGQQVYISLFSTYNHTCLPLHQGPTLNSSKTRTRKERKNRNTGQLLGAKVSSLISKTKKILNTNKDATQTYIYTRHIMSLTLKQKLGRNLISYFTPRTKKLLFFLDSIGDKQQYS